MPLGDSVDELIDRLKRSGSPVDPGHWQGVPTEGHPDLVTTELFNANFTAKIPQTQRQLELSVRPNMPWAEVEFQERVGRERHNPHHSMQSWPWWHGQIDEQMSHTYSERFWPTSKYQDSLGTQMKASHPFGIRYRYGDLDDVLTLLQQHPYTRQATLPIFFPEDTGAVHGGRIPCTLHYHFMLRNDRLHLWYPIRSCDAVRHFRDDVYMAGRLCQWVIEQLRVMDNDYNAQELWEGVMPGYMFFTAYSFHVHAGDRHLL